MRRSRRCLVVAALLATGLNVTAQQPAAADTVVARVNFQRETGIVPEGYVRDYGQAFDATRGYGWVEIDSPTPLSLVGNGRNRNLAADERLDTHVNMQYSGTNGVAVPGRWEHALPDGTYDVTVAVGDPAYTDSVHRLTADGGVVLIDDFQPTSGEMFRTATKRVTVTDGRLTLDPSGGVQTKIDYVDIVEVAIAPEPSGSITVTSPDENLRVGKRLVFSTVANEVRPAKAVTISNGGPGPLTVSDIRITGTDSASFALAADQPRSFVVAEGASRTVSIEFRPSPGVEHYAVVEIASSDGDQPSTTVELAGLNANGYEGQLEPTAAQILRVLGYTTNIGWSTYKVCTQTGSQERAACELPVGEEVLSPYWRRASTSAPVGLIPLARYANRVTTEAGNTGWTPYAPPSQTALPTRKFVMTFPGGDDISGGENQRLLPGIRGATTFTPTGDFGLYSYYSDFSDERFHRYNLHNFRFYPARGPTGAAIPNSYLVLFDPSGDSAKNWDYQDLMWLMTNVAPVWSTDGASTVVERTFAAGTAGTLADRNGIGTGFSATMPGSSHVAADLTVATAGVGTLTVTPRSGTSDGAANSQANMLANVLDATETDNQRLTARLMGPLCLPESGRTEAGVFFGHDQDHLYKLVAASDGAGGTRIEAVAEQLGTRTVTAAVAVPSCATLRYVDLTIRLFAGTARVGYQYRIVRTDGVDEGTVVGTTQFDTSHQQWWFNQAAYAGLVASSTSTEHWNATFDRWKFYLP